MFRKLLVAGIALAALLALGGVALAGLTYDFSTYDPTGATSAAGTATAEGTYQPLPGGGRRFEIDGAGSRVAFDIDEVLRGQPTTVTGTTDAVTGAFAVDPDDPSDVTFGELLIDAGTFATDSGLRDRAIRGPILGGDPIRFQPTAVRDAVAEDGRLRFVVDGDLTVRDATRPVSFAATAEQLDADRIAIRADAQVSRSELGIDIPAVPFVAEVSDTVTLRADLLAHAAPA